MGCVQGEKSKDKLVPAETAERMPIKIDGEGKERHPNIMKSAPPSYSRALQDYMHMAEIHKKKEQIENTVTRQFHPNKGVQHLLSEAGLQQVIDPVVPNFDYGCLFQS